MERIMLTFHLNLEVKNSYDVALLMEQLNKLANNPYRPTQQSSPLLSQFMEQELEKEKITSSTRYNRKTTIKWVNRLFPQLHLCDFSTHQLSVFRDAMEREGLSPNTIAKHLSHLRIFVQKAMEQNKIGQEWQNPLIFRTKRRPSHHSYLELEELRKLEACIPASPCQKRVWQAFLFSCYAGLRFSDVVRLNKSHLFRQENIDWLQIKMKKTQSMVNLPLSLLFEGKSIGILHNIQPHTPTEPFFPLGNNSNVNKVLQQICQKAGIDKHISFHSSRHTFATLLLNQGVPLEVIQKLLGHHNIKTTQVYAEMTQRGLVEQLRKTMEAI